MLLSVAGAAGAVAVLVLAPDLPAEQRDAVRSAVVAIPAYGLAGAFLVSRRPDLPFGWLLTGAAAALVVALAAGVPAQLALAAGDRGPLVAAGMTAGSLAFVPVAVQGLVNVRFPGGRPVGRSGRVLERLLVAGTVLVVLGGVLGDGPLGEPPAGTAPLVNPYTDGTVVGAVGSALVGAAPLVVLLGLVAGIGVVVRCVRATGVERQQLLWRSAGVVAALALFPLAVTDRLGPVTGGADAVLFVTTLAIPVVRYRLWAIDSILRRSVAYAVVTVVLVVAFAGIATVGAALVSERVGVSAAAVAVAFGFAPVRTRAQQLVDRLFYGRRNDPYAAMTDLGRRLGAVAMPGEVLPAVVTAVAGSLRLPYVAVEGPADGPVLAAHGRPGPVVERWPLVYQGVPVGVLAASPRRGEAEFGPRDRAVLADIARQAGPAVRAEALTADLLESRQRLVTAREEERRRLRRDLHDGLGPLLTGLGLNLDAARAALAGGSAPDGYLGAAKDASTQAIADLRGLVHGLRPPALDDLGLLGGIRAQAARLGPGVALDVSAGALPELPAAVEVAAFRVAVEAVTNAVRHGGARRCTVRLDAGPGPELVLAVTDDGRSTGPWPAGVGLTAMRERAGELGGTVEAGPGPDGGRVVARYPLPGGPP